MEQHDKAERIDVRHMCPECAGNVVTHFCSVCLGVGSLSTAELARYEYELNNGLRKA